MAASRKEIVIALQGKDEGASGLLSDVGKKLRLLKMEARASGENYVEQMFSGGNFTNGAMNLIGGAKAAIAGFFVEKAGEALGGWAEQAIKLEEELNAGNISTGEMLDKLAGGVPIFGSVWTAGRAIHDLLVGDSEEIAKINDEATFTREIFDAQAASAKMVREQYRSVKNEIIAMRLELAKMGAGPTAGALLDVENDRQQRPEQIGETFKKRRDDLNADHNKQTGLIAKRRQSLANQLANIGGEDAEWLEPAKFAEIKNLSRDIDIYAASIEARYAKQSKSLTEMEKTEKGLAAASADKRKKMALDDDPTGLAVKQARETSANAMAAAIQEELRAAGKTYEAEIKGIWDRAKQDQIAAMEAAQAEVSSLHLDTDSDAAKSIMGSGREKSAAIGRRAAAEEIEAKKRLRMEEGDATSAALQKELALHGDALGAQLEQIRSNYADRIDMAKSEAEKEALVRQQAADVADAKRTAAIEKRDKEYGRRKMLQSVLLDELDYNSATSSSAKRAAMKAHIDQETADRVHDLQKIIDDKTSSPEEKAQARAKQAQVRADAAQREDFIDQSPVEGSRKGIQATLLSDRYHGLAEQYRAGQEPALIEARKLVAQTVYLKTISDNIALIAQKGTAIKGRTISS